MRIEFTTEGGIAYFPGLSRPVAIDDIDLSAEEHAELARLLEGARFFELPHSIGTPSPGAADYRRYTIHVDDDGRQHAVTLVDPVTDSDLQQLVRFLQAKARVLQRGGRSP